MPSAKARSRNADTPASLKIDPQQAQHGRGPRSKLHAHINIGTEGSATINDAGSRNGTQVNKVKLEDGKPIAIKSSDTVTSTAKTLARACAHDRR